MRAADEACISGIAESVYNASERSEAAKSESTQLEIPNVVARNALSVNGNVI